MLTNKLLYKAALLVLMGACGDVAIESFQVFIFPFFFFFSNNSFYSFSLKSISQTNFVLFCFF